MKTSFAAIRKDYAKQAGALICGAALAFTMLVPSMDGVCNWDATDLSTEEGAYQWEVTDVANWSTVTNAKGHTVSQIVAGTAN